MTAQIIILSLIGLFVVWRFCLWLFKEDKPTPPPVPKSTHLPPRYHDEPACMNFIPAHTEPPKTPFQTQTQKEIEAELDASLHKTINHFKSGAKPHPKPRKH